MGIFQKPIYRLGDHLQVLAYSPDNKLFFAGRQRNGFRVCLPTSLRRG